MELVFFIGVTAFLGISGWLYGRNPSSDAADNDAAVGCCLNILFCGTLDGSEHRAYQSDFHQIYSSSSSSSTSDYANDDTSDDGKGSYALLRSDSSKSSLASEILGDYDADSYLHVDRKGVQSIRPKQTNFSRRRIGEGNGLQKAEIKARTEGELIQCDDIEVQSSPEQMTLMQKENPMHKPHPASESKSRAPSSSKSHFAHIPGDDSTSTSSSGDEYHQGNQTFKDRQLDHLEEDYPYQHRIPKHISFADQHEIRSFQKYRRKPSKFLCSVIARSKDQDRLSRISEAMDAFKSRKMKVHPESRKNTAFFGSGREITKKSYLEAENQDA